MPGLTPRERSPAGIDPIAATWGGLVAAIGLMAGVGQAWPLRALVTAAAFLVGGFLAGVRASERRPVNALAAAVVAHLLHAAYVGIARVIDLVGGPAAPELTGGSAARWLGWSGWAAAFALLGGALAASWLRPAQRRRRAAPRAQGR